MSAIQLQTTTGLSVWRGYAAGEFTSPVYDVAPFNRAVMSWNCSGAAKFELEVAGVWHVMGLWSDKPQSAKTAVVDVDLARLAKPAESFRFRVTAEPGSSVALVAVAHWMSGEKSPFASTHSAAWGKIIDVPQRSQRVVPDEPMRICSPTTIAMVLEYYGFKLSIREVADGVFDHAAKIYGNWPFNTAYAHKISGRECFVRRGVGLEDLEDEIAAGRPVIISHSWKRGDLDSAPLPESTGHLIVVVGFTNEGDVVVNDPAGTPDSVRRIYKRAQFYKTWLQNGCGIMYVIQNS